MYIYILLVLFLQRTLIQIWVTERVLEKQNLKNDSFEMFWSFWDWLSNLIRFKNTNDYTSSRWDDIFCEISRPLSPATHVISQ